VTWQSIGFAHLSLTPELIFWPTADVQSTNDEQDPARVRHKVADVRSAEHDAADLSYVAQPLMMASDGGDQSGKMDF
jgi:hypothetical protein